MTANDNPNTKLTVRLNSVDVSVKDLEMALFPVDDHDEAEAILHILYGEH